MRCENRNRLAAASLMPISYPFHSCQEHVRRFGEEASLQARNAVNDASEEPSAMTCVNQNQVYQEETLETPPGNLDGSLASHQPADRQESIEEDSMEFNIHQQVFDENGEYFEKEEQRYLDQLVELFEASPEAQVLQNEGAEPCWIGMLFDYAIRYLGVTPAQMTASDLRELLFDLVPRKISAPAEDAPEIIREMQMFWTFAGREFHLGNAEACLKILDDKAVRLLREEMGNSDNFGFAKSFVMQGMERGFDMSNQEDLDEWMQIYNTELAHTTPLPFSLPEPWIAPLAIAEDREPGRRKTSAEKNRRKMAKHSRKQNRKR